MRTGTLLIESNTFSAHPSLRNFVANERYNSLVGIDLNIAKWVEFADDRIEMSVAVDCYTTATSKW